MKRGRSRYSSGKNSDADSLFDENAAFSWGKNLDEEEIDETEDDASAEVGALSGRCDFTFLAKDDKPGALDEAEKIGVLSDVIILKYCKKSMKNIKKNNFKMGIDKLKIHVIMLASAWSDGRKLI